MSRVVYASGLGPAAAERVGIPALDPLKHVDLSFNHQVTEAGRRRRLPRACQARCEVFWQVTPVERAGHGRHRWLCRGGYRRRTRPPVAEADAEALLLEVAGEPSTD